MSRIADWVGSRKIFWLLVAASLLAGLSWLRTLTTPSPIYASDEYAYLKRAQLMGQPPEVAARDPYLQALDNRLYFKVINAARAFSPDVTSVVRALNFAGYYGLLGLGGYFWFRSRTRALGGGVFVFLLCAQAFSVYVLSLMPDVGYSVLFTVGAWLLVTRVGTRPVLSIVSSGLIFVSLLYIKPHAVAIISAFLLFVPLDSFLRRETWPKVLGKAGLGLAVVAAGVAIFNTWLFNDFSLKAHFIGPFYANNTSGGLKPWLSVDRFRQAAGLSVLHTLGLLILFPTLLLLPIRGPDGVFARGSRTAFLQPLAVFASLCTAVVLVMVIKFSVEVGALSAGEGGRLHGRYVAFLFPLFAWLVAEWAESSRPRTRRFGGVIAYAVAVTVFLICLPAIRVFPWDYADLFIFFNGTNAYWPFPQMEWVRPVVLVAGAILVVLGLVRKMTPGAILFSLGVLVSLGSLARVTFWQENHARFHQRFSDAGRALRQAQGDIDEKLMMIGTERYGWMSYVLYGYDEFPWVRQVAAGEKLQALPDVVTLAAAVGAVDSPFEAATFQPFGPLSLFGRDRAAAGGFVSSAPLLKSGEGFSIPFQAPRPGAMVWGFNESEPWGAWTSKPVARVILNRKISGKVRVSGVSWVASVSESTFRLSLGESTIQVPATATPQPFSVEFELASPADELQVQYPVYREQPWSRPLGVALTQLEFLSH